MVIVASVTGDGVATDTKEYGMNDGLPMKFGGVVGNDNNELFFLGGSPSTPSSVYKWSLDGKAPAQILGCSSTLSFPDDDVEAPSSIVKHFNNVSTCSL